MSSLSESLEKLNKSLNTSLYTPYISFKVGDFEIRTSDKNSNYFLSVENCKNGSGQANSFTISIAFVPNPNSSKFNTVNYIDEKLLGVLSDNKDCIIKYGYDCVQAGYGNEPLNLSSPEYSGRILDYSIEIRNGMLYYTFTGYSSIVTLNESKISIEAKGSKDDDGNVTDGVRATQAAYDELSKALTDTDYTVEIDESAKDKDIVQVIGAMNDVTIFEYVKSVLASAKDESTEDNTSNENYVTYSYKIDSINKKVIIYRIDPTDKDDIDIQFIFDWMNGNAYSNQNGNNLVIDFKTEFKGAIVLAVSNNNTKTSYSLDSEGKEVETTSIEESPTVADVADSDSNIEKSKWATATQTSYKATLTTLGIPYEIPIGTYVKIRPIILGVEHHTAGNYMVTKVTDNITSAGFTSTLELIKLHKPENDTSTETESVNVDIDINDYIEPDEDGDVDVDIDDSIPGDMNGDGVVDIIDKVIERQKSIYGD